MSTGTVRFHRVLTAPPERVYRAFLDADAMAKWLPPHGFTGHVHKMDARVGGSYRMSFTNFSSGKSHAFGGTYLELVPNERLRYTATFDDPNLPGEMQTTIVLRKVSVGTEIDIVQEGIPAVIPPEACCLGWQESLTLDPGGAKAGSRAAEVDVYVKVNYIPSAGGAGVGGPKSHQED